MTNGNKFYFPVNYNINGRKNSLTWSLDMRSSIIIKGGKTPSKHINIYTYTETHALIRK